MEAFATGFSLSSETKPGYSLENDDYKIIFSEVICDQGKNIVSRGFENCYNWKDVMELVLNVADEADTDVLIDIEASTEDAIRDWLVTFSGWGLLSSILDSKIHRHVLLSLAYTSSNWDPDTGGEFSEEKVFNTVKYVYDNMPGKEMHTLVPKFAIWFEEISSGRKEMERRKEITLFFNAKWALEVKFFIEKKRKNQTLVDLAAESVVKNILIEEDICDLPIPETLFPVVLNKFCDIEWIRSYWNSQSEHTLEELKNAQKAEEEEKKCQAVDVAAGGNLSDDDEAENVEEEEFLSAVIDDVVDDVQQIIDNHIDIRAVEPGQSPSVPGGVDTILLVWVGLFLILAVILYSYC